MFLSTLLASSFWAAITNYFANFDGATNICRTVILYLVLALTIALIACKLAVKKEKQPLVNKIALFVAIGFSLAVIVTFAVLSFVEDDIVAISFYPLLVFIIVCVVGALLVTVKPQKPVKIAVLATIAAAFVAAFVCLIVYYASGASSEWNYVDKKDVNEIGLYISSVILVAGIALLAFFSDRRSESFNSRSIAFAAVCIALSFALSYVRLFKMPMGGSITFASMLPIMLFSYMYGARKGVAAGLIYGVLQAVQDPWILHPAQFLMDYGTAFASIGLTGCIKGFGLLNGKVRSQFTVGAVIAGVMRFISHFFAGAFAFASYGRGYAEEFGISALNNPYIYSFIYQCMYVIPEVIICVVAAVILLSSKSFVKQMDKYTAKKTVAAEEGTTDKKALVPEVATTDGEVKD